MKKILLIVFLVLNWYDISYAQSIRKPWREMTSAEKQDLVLALNNLSTNIPQTLASEHNRIALLFGQNNHIHNSNIFLPWHRIFILYLEERLQAFNPLVSLPYWDWTEDWSSSSELFEDNTGGNTGLFGYSILSTWEDPSTGQKYTRSFNNFLPQPTNSSLSAIINTNNFSQHRTNLESIPHNNGHNLIGGSMATMFSPADPIFFLHHCMVDKVWNDWVEANWNGGNLNFSDDADPVLSMLTFIGYQGSTNQGNVVRVNPNAWIDSRNSKVWYAENNEVSLNNYSVTGAELYRYTGIINMEDDFTVPSSRSCDVVSGTRIHLKKGFRASTGSSFHAYLDPASFNSINGRIALNHSSTEADKSKYKDLLEASISASKDLTMRSSGNVYGVARISELSKQDDENVEVYPNPCRGKFYVNIKDLANMKIYDALGKEVKITFGAQGNGDQYEVEFAQIEKGYYTVQFERLNGQFFQRKLIVI